MLTTSEMCVGQSEADSMLLQLVLLRLVGRYGSDV